MTSGRESVGILDEPRNRRVTPIQHFHLAPTGKTFETSGGTLFFPVRPHSASQLIDIITRCHSMYVVSISNHTGGPMEKFNWRPRNSQFNSSQPANARRAGKNYPPRARVAGKSKLSASVAWVKSLGEKIYPLNRSPPAKICHR